MPQITDLASVRQARLNRSHNPDKTFTSWKFDVLNCLFVDPRSDATAKIVAVFILQHVNQHTGAAFPGIETISDGTAISARHVRRAIKLLQQTGWLTVTRKNRRAPNVYTFSERNMNQMLDRLAILREGRAGARLKKRAFERTQESYQKWFDRT
jgi:DNA-binding transcriptional regulator PaaX